MRYLKELSDNNNIKLEYGKIKSKQKTIDEFKD